VTDERRPAGWKSERNWASRVRLGLTDVRVRFDKRTMRIAGREEGRGRTSADLPRWLRGEGRVG